MPCSLLITFIDGCRQRHCHRLCDISPVYYARRHAILLRHDYDASLTPRLPIYCCRPLDAMPAACRYLPPPITPAMSFAACRAFHYISAAHAFTLMISPLLILRHASTGYAHDHNNGELRHLRCRLPILIAAASLLPATLDLRAGDAAITRVMSYARCAFDADIYGDDAYVVERALRALCASRR